MGAKEIMAKKFEMVLRGYKTEEVEDFLREVSIDFSRLKKENEDLENKLGVLADKIREYREDEDTLKDALLGAQRQGNALIADSKRKAAEIIEEAQNKVTSMIKQAEEDRQKLNEKGDNEIKAAQEKAANIIDSANKKARDIENEMNLKTNVQKEILHRTTKEINEFKNRIISSYKEHMASIEKISRDCENEFIKKTLKEGRPNLKNHSLKNQDKQENNGNDINSGELSQTEPQLQITESEPIENSIIDDIIQFEVKVDNSGNVNNDNIGNTGEIHLENTNEIFYKKSQDIKSRNRSKQNLQFGGKNNEN